MRCKDDECGNEFTRDEADLDWTVFLTEPTEMSESGEAEFNIDCQVDVCCPSCGTPVEDSRSGETNFTVEMG